MEETAKKYFKSDYIRYYDLLEITYKDGEVMHIPIPFLEKNYVSKEWLKKVKVSKKRRDGSFFHCPICGNPSFFAGICADCYNNISDGDEETEEVEKRVEKREQHKHRRKTMFMIVLNKTGKPPLTVEKVEYIRCELMR